jgi:hypothetical protein
MLLSLARVEQAEHTVSRTPGACVPASPARDGAATGQAGRRERVTTTSALAAATARKAVAARKRPRREEPLDQTIIKTAPVAWIARLSIASCGVTLFNRDSPRVVPGATIGRSTERNWQSRAAGVWIRS